MGGCTIAPSWEAISCCLPRRERLEDALADSVTRKKIDFLLLDQEDFRTVTVDYADGIRYLELARDADKPDLLAEILKARAK